MIDFTVLDKAIRSFMEQSRISFSYSFAGEHNEKRLSRAQKIFANNVDASQVYLQIDATISDSGRSGCVYTYNEVFIKDTGERCTISYHEIKGLTFIGKYNFIVSYRDGSAVKVFAPCSPVEVVSVLWAFASYYALSEHPEDPTVTTSYAVSPTLTCVFDSVIPSPALQTPQSKNENTDTSKSFQSVDSATNKQSIQCGQNVEPIQEISACNETVDKIICTNCGAVLQDGYAFCIKCGNPVNATQSIPISRQDNAISPSVNNSVPIQNNSIEKSIPQQKSTSPASFCTNCGAVLQDGYAFCIKCGNPVNATQSIPTSRQDNAISPSVNNFVPIQNNSIEKSIPQQNSTSPASFCTNCGAVLQDGYAFCIKCGNPVNATQSIPTSRQDNAISHSVNNSAPIQNNSIEKSIPQQNSTSPASFCTNCGAVLQDGYAFCIKCGKPVCAVQNTTEQAQGMPFNPPAATQPVLDLHPRCSFEYIPIKTDIPAGTASYSGNTPKMIDFCCTGDDIAYIRDRLSSFSLSTAYTDELPPKKLMSALRYMAPGLPAMKVVGFVDTTLFGSCKEGILISPDFFFLRKGDEKFSIDFKMMRNVTIDKSSDTVTVEMLNGIYYPLCSENFTVMGEGDNDRVLYELLHYMLLLVEKHGLRPQIRISNNFINNIDSIASKYRIRLAKGSKVYFRGEMPVKQFTIAKNNYAKSIIPWQCILFSDTTFFGNAKNGIIVTIWGIYSNSGNHQTAVYFSDIDSLSVTADVINVKLINGSRFAIKGKAVKANKLKQFIDEVMAFYASYLSNPGMYEHDDEYDYYKMLSLAYTDLSSFSNDFLIEQAKLGNHKAAIQLAQRARTGMGMPFNIMFSLDLLGQVQSAEAYRIIGEIYYNGEGIPRNTEIAEENFKTAAELGDLLAETALGNMCFLGINREHTEHKKAFGIYKRIYDTVEYDKIPVSLKVNLGICYLYGYGCDKNIRKAHELLTSVKDVDCQAKYLLSMLYIENKDYNEKAQTGIDWLHELADRQGYAAAGINLGILYFTGEWVEADVEKALYYLEKIKQINKSEPNYSIGCYYYALMLFYKDKNCEQAVYYLKEAAERGMVDALRDLAVMYQFGLGVKKDIMHANELYAKAALGGDYYSENWRDYTKKYLNSLRTMSKVYANESEDDDLYISETKELDENCINGIGLNSYVFNYPIEESKNLPEDRIKKLKRKYAGLERNLISSAQVSLNQSNVGSIFMNFTKFRQVQGHGHAFEYANHVEDLFHFKAASWKGGDNVKGGADRVVGLFKQTEIQSKCYRDAKMLYNHTFDKNGNPIYVGENGKPMVIETTSDTYDEYRKMVIDNKGEEYANKYTQASKYSNKQVENIGKFGTIESLKVDAKLGIVTATRGAMISAVVTFSVSKINGADNEEAVKSTLRATAKAFGTTFAITMISSQLLKATPVVNALENSHMLNKMANSKSLQKVVSKSTGTAASASEAKNFLKGSVVTGAVTIAVLSSADILRIISGRISKEQLFKNVAVTTASVAAGSAGFAVGAACGSVIPVVGTFIGGFIGSAVASSVASKAVKCTLDVFIENDGDKMLEILNGELGMLAEEYMLAEDELNLVIDDLRGSDLLTDSGLRDIFQSSDRKVFCRNKLTPMVEEICMLRNYIASPSEEDIAKGFEDFSNDEDVQQYFSTEAVPAM